MSEVFDKSYDHVINGPNTHATAARLLRTNGSIDIGMRINGHNWFLYMALPPQQGYFDVYGRRLAVGDWLYIGIRTPGRFQLIGASNPIEKVTISDWRLADLDADGRAKVLAFFEGVRQHYKGIAETAKVAEVNPAPDTATVPAPALETVKAILEKREEQLVAEDDDGIPRLYIPEL